MDAPIMHSTASAASRKEHPESASAQVQSPTRIHNKTSQMPGGHPFAQVRRKQQGCIALNVNEGVSSHI